MKYRTPLSSGVAAFAFVRFAAVHRLRFSVHQQVEEFMRQARVFLIATLMAIGATTVACGSRTVETSAGEIASPDTSTALLVDNQSLYDMTIYLLEGGSVRRRLGSASALSRTRIPISRTIVGNGRDLQFLADPFAAPGRAITRRIFVSPGDEVVLTITR